LLSLQQNGEEEGRTCSAQKQGKDLEKRGGGEAAQTIYTHVSKCKNDKIKGEKKKVHEKKRQCTE
jgi:hypothetical protein